MHISRKKMKKPTEVHHVMGFSFFSFEGERIVTKEQMQKESRPD